VDELRKELEIGQNSATGSMTDKGMEIALWFY